MNLKNFEKSFSEINKAKAAKLSVRECDEEPKGNFIAYVDQDNRSFDVHIRLGINGSEVETMDCDCSEGSTYCIHKFAMLQFIKSKAKVEKTKIVKKETNDPQSLLDNVSILDLHNWILDLFDKDKALLTAFKLQFYPPKTDNLTEKQIIKQLKELAINVAGRKKKVDPTTFDKIAKLWEMFVMPIAEGFLKGPLEEKTLNNLEMLISAIEVVAYSYSTRSFLAVENIEKGIFSLLAHKYVQLSENTLGPALFNLNKKLQSFQKSFEKAYLEVIEQVFDAVDSKKQEIVVEHMVSSFEDHIVSSNFGNFSYSNLLVKLLDKTDNFEKYVEFLKPIYYDNNFNKRLIERLFEIKKFDLIEKHCYTIMKSNVRQEYNEPYIAYLKKIYLEQGNNDSLRRLLKDEVEHTANFDDFLEVYCHISAETDKAEYRNQTFAKIRRKSVMDKNKSAISFTVKLLAYEQNWKLLIGYLKDYQDLTSFIPYLESMLTFDEKKVITGLGKHSTAYFSGSCLEEEGLFKTNSKVSEIMYAHFGKDRLVEIISKEVNRLGRLNNNSIFHLLWKELIVDPAN